METTQVLVAVELTESEKQLIEINREKMRLAEEEKRVKKLASQEKEIATEEHRILVDTAECSRQVEATRNFFLQFDAKKYTLNIRTVSRRKYVLDKDYIKDADGNYTIVWEKNYEVECAEILRNDSNVKISISEHISGTGYHKNNLGYKMTILGMGYDQERHRYTNVKKVVEKIEQFVTRKTEEKKVSDQKAKLLLSINFSDTRLKDYIAEEGPVTLYRGGYRGRNWDKYMNAYSGWQVKYKNGIIVELAPVTTADGNCTWSIVDIRYPRPETPKGDLDDVMAQLAGAPTFAELHK